MQVKYSLSGPLAIVNNQAEIITMAGLSGDLAGRFQQVAQQCAIGCGGISHPGDGLLGNDQHMQRRLGIDIPKGQALLILIHDIGRDLAPDYLAEYGTHIPPFDRERDSSPIVRKG